MSNPWKIALVGTLIHLFLGTVYAWSFFQSPIMELTQWNNLQTTMAFSLTIFTLGVTASWAGSKLEVYGARKLTISGGLLFGAGYVLASFALQQTHLWGFYLSFGLVGGCGLGLAYVTPVAVVSRWFNKKQGLATGMVVMGFGLGAFLMSKILAPLFFEFTEQDVALSFRYFGIGFMLIIPLLGAFLKSPKPTSTLHATALVPATEGNSGKAVLIWLIFTLNIIVGMIFLAFQSPLLQELMLKKESATSKEILVGAGATLIAVSAFFNGIGRLLWASLSDKIGRVVAFRWLIALEVLCFTMLIITQNVVLFSALVCLVLLCYGGGFGILPSLIKDEFGTAKMPKIYGMMLTGWGIGGIIGTLSTAFLKDTFAKHAGVYAFCVGLCAVVVALLLTFFLKTKKQSTEQNNTSG